MRNALVLLTALLIPSAIAAQDAETVEPYDLDRAIDTVPMDRSQWSELQLWDLWLPEWETQLRELIDRLCEERTTNEQWRRFFQRISQENPDALRDFAFTRSRWPVGVPIRIRLGPTWLTDCPESMVVRARISGTDEWVQFPDAGGRHTTGKFWSSLQPIDQEGLIEIEMEIVAGADIRSGKDRVHEITEENADVVWHGKVRAVEMVEDVKDIIKPFASRSVDQWIGSQLSPGLLIDDTGRIGLTTRFVCCAPAESRNVNFGVGVRVEALYRGEVVAVGNWNYYVPPDGLNMNGMMSGPSAELFWLDGRKPDDIKKARLEKWIVRLVGDPEIAINDISPRTHYWDGTVEFARYPKRRFGNYGTTRWPDD